MQLLAYDIAYFQTIRDLKMAINAEDLDLKFNSIVNYLNMEILPKINKFIKKEYAGISDPLLVNAINFNIGNGKTEWRLAKGNLLIGQIDFSKFYADGTVNVISSNYNNNFSALLTNNIENFDIFCSRYNNSNMWRKLNSGDIQERTLTGDQVELGTIGIENLTDQFLLKSTCEIAKDAFIVWTKFKDNAINESHFNSNLVYKFRQERKKLLAKSSYPIGSRVFSNQHIKVCRLAFRRNMMQDAQSYSEYCFTKQYVPINGDRVYPMTPIIAFEKDPFRGRGYYGILEEKHFENGAIHSKHLINESINLNKLLDNTKQKISKRALDPRIRAALNI